MIVLVSQWCVCVSQPWARLVGAWGHIALMIA